jgi:hypothetical protein
MKEKKHFLVDGQGKSGYQNKLKVLPTSVRLSYAIGRLTLYSQTP